MTSSFRWRKQVVAMLACMSGTVLVAGTAYLSASDGATAPLNTPITVTGPDGVCKKITNASATGLSEYIPTASVAEWQSFVANPPAGVTVAPCVSTWISNAHCTGSMLGSPRGYDSATGLYTERRDATSCLNACTQYANSCCEFDTYTNPYYPLVSTEPTTSICILYEGTGIAGGTSTQTAPTYGLRTPIVSQAVAPISSTQPKTCAPLSGPTAQTASMTNFFQLSIYTESGTPVAGSSYFTASMINKCQRACGMGGTSFCTATEYPAYGEFPHFCQFTVPGYPAQAGMYPPYVSSCN